MALNTTLRPVIASSRTVALRPSDSVRVPDSSASLRLPLTVATPATLTLIEPVRSAAPAGTASASMPPVVGTSAETSALPVFSRIVTCAPVRLTALSTVALRSAVPSSAMLVCPAPPPSGVRVLMASAADALLAARVRSPRVRFAVKLRAPTSRSATCEPPSTLLRAAKAKSPVRLPRPGRVSVAPSAAKVCTVSPVAKLTEPPTPPTEMVVFTARPSVLAENPNWPVRLAPTRPCRATSPLAATA